MLKRTRKPDVGADGEEREPTKGTHKNDYETHWMFSVLTKLQHTVVNCHTTSNVPFDEVYNVMMHCKLLYVQMCIFPL